MLVLLALGVVASPVRAQRLPVEAGDRVRVAAPDSAGPGQWREGNVLAATRLGVLLSGRSFGGDTVPVALNPSIRLQISRRSIPHVALGTVAGFAIGAGFGAVGPDQWADDRSGHTGEVVVGALIGTLAGWGASWLFGPRRWNELSFAAGGAVTPAPLIRVSGRQARFGRLERWQVFPATEEDFGAFFWAHRDSLHVIEGLWQRLPATNDDRVAIVRDDRYPDWAYVAVSLPRLRALDQPQGRIIWALRRRREAGSYELFEIEVSGVARGGTEEVLVRDDALQIRPSMREWVRVPLSPPR